ncbi:MAG: PspC domain-containing protein [Candidatus Marinimicrobia bacterium]|jgi:phage shock protein PspC (stress-responsive transcriptional regulator)|nr:PspC domain-containing protein [Candidatus Neomarinimicrobiota bacterium]MBT3502052.1 PspC domain-containing protein [Candidatus Neomarinimicrobiota bacterium]MBT3839112.1 PspC domain-containing protein [Candidatus Neomarinimicrobiota bacterium]MBT3998952.1 PspC domain-containing protein [Candidatus Neomarinimicrobiota bacterium]MBT4283476.1 PspC domain-containing protein [Candidatus Neomarinimicrobiota bacterium]
MKKLYRIPQEGKIAGVCVGMGEYFDIDPVIVRLFFLLSLFMGGGLIVYIIAWIIVPKISRNPIDQKTTETL